MNELENAEGKIKEKREGTRTWLAKGLSCFFAFTIVASVILPLLFDQVDSSVFGMLISTLAPLFGVVLGFYFGKQGN